MTVHMFKLAYSARFVHLILLLTCFFLPLEPHERMTILQVIARAYINKLIVFIELVVRKSNKHLLPLHALSPKLPQPPLMWHFVTFKKDCVGVFIHTAAPHFRLVLHIWSIPEHLSNMLGVNSKNLISNHCFLPTELFTMIMFMKADLSFLNS